MHYSHTQRDNRNAKHTIWAQSWTTSDNNFTMSTWANLRAIFLFLGRLHIFAHQIEFGQKVEAARNPLCTLQNNFVAKPRQITINNIVMRACMTATRAYLFSS